MNWGKKILMFYAVFVVGIMYLVLNSMKMEQDLVTPDYYAQELKYQQRIDEKNRTANLIEKVSVSKYDKGIEINFPEEISRSGFIGEVWIYCPNDKNQDKSVKLELKPGEKIIQIEYLYKGYRQIKINGVTLGSTYYFEQKIYL